MSAPPEYLPPAPPPGYQLFAWCGAILLLPREWNLCRYEGNRRRAGLVFADLARPRLFLRWQSRKGRFRKAAADPVGRAVARFVKRFPAARVERPSGLSACILLSGERFLLAANDERLYELCWPGESEGCDPVFQSFLHTMNNPCSGYWDVYGARAVFPAQARWKHISLQPGSPRITLVLGSLVCMAGAFSMADRLLAEGSLREVGSRLLRLAELPGQWKGIEGFMYFEGEVQRRWRGPMRFQFVFVHRAPENRISWQLTAPRRFLKIWRP